MGSGPQTDSQALRTYFVDTVAGQSRARQTPHVWRQGKKGFWDLVCLSRYHQSILYCHKYTICYLLKIAGLQIHTLSIDSLCIKYTFIDRMIFSLLFRLCNKARSHMSRYVNDMYSCSQSTPFMVGGTVEGGGGCLQNKPRYYGWKGHELIIVVHNLLYIVPIDKIGVPRFTGGRVKFHITWVTKLT